MKKHRKTRVSPMLGKHHSEKTKEQISKTMRGKNIGPRLETTKNKISKTRKRKFALGQLKVSEETRRKLSKAMKGINNPFYGKHHNKKTIEKIRKARLNQTFNKRETFIERKTERILEDLLLNFKKQFPLERTIIDFVLPEEKIAIYCDGDYWHSLDEVKKRDKQIDIFLKKLGWTVLRFSETEIKENILVVKETIWREVYER